MRTSTEQILADIARTHAGVVALRDARAAGITPAAFHQYARRHKPNANYHGAYTFYALDDKYGISEADDDWFIKMHAAGLGSYFVGSTALDFYKLGLQIPSRTYMRSPSRKPGTIKTIVILPPKKDAMIDTIRGIRVQNLYQAFKEAGEVRNDRLLAAAEQAWDRNLLNIDQYHAIVRFIKKRMAPAKE